MDGNEFVYYDDGKLAMFNQWKLGKRHGFRRSYSVNKNIFESYQDGELIDSQF
jgi:hypothetical protein